MQSEFNLVFHCVAWLIDQLCEVLTDKFYQIG